MPDNTRWNPDGHGGAQRQRRGRPDARELRRSLRRGAPWETPPPGLRGRIMEFVRDQAPDAPPRRLDPMFQPRRRPYQRGGGVGTRQVALLAVAATTFLAASAVFWTQTNTPPQPEHNASPGDTQTLSPWETTPTHVRGEGLHEPLLDEARALLRDVATLGAGVRERIAEPLIR
jgi:hypothetical protein